MSEEHDSSDSWGSLLIGEILNNFNQVCGKNLMIAMVTKSICKKQ